MCVCRLFILIKKIIFHILHLPTSATTPRAQSTQPLAQTPAFLTCARNCLTTNEYNPVCGTDQVAYPNIRRLGCANLCGRRLDSNWQGNIPRFTP